MYYEEENTSSEVFLQKKIHNLNLITRKLWTIQIEAHSTTRFACTFQRMSRSKNINKDREIIPIKGDQGDKMTKCKYKIVLNPRAGRK